ncbi:hypothetical protein ACMD2_16528 [Ananas comosus]|uniref:Uncharacterized protein n=1 Tax=Ananas comosus TaxID=4615 RepID=A0A199UTH6_ANACO|nr:hypothetical protein ACMD2_16528 [Ananas comosus]
MAEYRDEYGNRVPVVDQYGNPVSRVDEHGNPIRGDPTGTGGYGSMATAATERAAATATEGGRHETTKERHGIVLHRSGSSSSSSYYALYLSLSLSLSLHPLPNPSFRRSSPPPPLMAIPGPYSGVSTLAFVARTSAFAFGVVYGSVKLSYLKAKAKSHKKAEEKSHH